MVTLGTDAELSKAEAEAAGALRLTVHPQASSQSGPGHGGPPGGPWRVWRGGAPHFPGHGPPPPHHHHGPHNHHGRRHHHGRDGERGDHLRTKVARKNLARFVSMRPDDGTVLLPGSAFTKTWRVRNDTSEPWPADALLLFVGGEESMLPDGSRRLPLDGVSLQPGEEGDVKAELEAPA